MAQIATIKVQTENNGIEELPVFDTSDAGSSVYDMVRVQTPSGIGFVPFVDPLDADRPYLRLQTQSHGVLAAHSDSTISTAIVDNFEDGDLDEYTTDTPEFNVSTNTVYEGTYSLEMGIGNNGGYYEIFSSTSDLQDDLANYPSQGDTFRAKLYRNGNNTNNVGRMGFMWGVSSSNDYYRFWRSFTNGETYLQKVSSGSSTNLDTVSTAGPTDSWENAEVEWNTDGSMTINMSYTSSTLNATDSEHTAEGIGWGTQVAGTNDSGVDGHADLYEII